MAQYMLAVRINEEKIQNIDSDVMKQTYHDTGVLNQKLKDAGAWVFGGGLLPSSEAKVVKYENGETITTDGPYVEAKEQVGGFWLIEAADLDEAMAWAEEATIACQDPIELRPFEGA